ncbi:MAG: hypothetical protein P8N76_26185 [Pirellulaceae bacterium]|nr:hypothetical protein [Pirellulaceae bacterium]
MNIKLSSEPRQAVESKRLILSRPDFNFEPDWFLVELHWQDTIISPTEKAIRCRLLTAALPLLTNPNIVFRRLSHDRMLVSLDTCDAKIDMRVSADSVAIMVQVTGDAEAAVRFCENVSSTGRCVTSRVQTIPEREPTFFFPSDSGYLFSREIARQKSPYQRITLSEHPIYGRALLLGDEIQIGERDEQLFSRGLVSHAMNANAKRVLILGGGDCGVLREVLTHPVERVVMVELDREVVNFCRKHFPEIVAESHKDPRAELRFEDAFKYLANCTERFDLVLSDLPDTPLANYTLDDQISLMSHVLTEDGILGTHAELTKFADNREQEPILAAISKRFENVETTQDVIPSFQDQIWLFVRASKLKSHIVTL